MINEYASRKRTKKLREDLKASEKEKNIAFNATNKFRAELEAAEEAITNLRDDANERAAELSRANVTIEEQAKAIATFKEEHLTLMLEVAEMRGYISRTLEDDHVREFGPAKMMAEPVMADGERENMIRHLHDDHRKRTQPPRPVRQGPMAMRPLEFVNPAYAAGNDDFSRVMRHGAMERKPPMPKHWTAR